MNHIIYVVAAVSLLATPAMADIPSYKSCMSKTFNRFVGNVIFPNLKGMFDSVDARAACRAHLTEDEAARIYSENKGWYDLHRKGGPLDPTRRGYSERI